MRKHILNWLFGTDDIQSYFNLLSRSIDHNDEKICLIDEHLETLRKHKEDLILIRKLIKICENHGIDVDEEIKKIDGDDL